MGLFSSLFGSNEKEEPSFVTELRDKAEAGNYDACIKLADHYVDSLKDYNEASKWLKRAYEMAPNMDAAFKVGFNFLCMERIRDAVDWIFKSEELGNPKAKNFLDDAANSPSMILAYSEQLGKKASIETIAKSQENNWPIWAETDEEYQKLDFFEHPLFIEGDLTQYPASILDAVRYWGEGSYLGLYHPLKIRYLLNKLNEQAESGSLVAMYCLIYYQNIYPLSQEKQNEYSETIAKYAQRKEPLALYLKGLQAEPLTEERFGCLLEATLKGNSDAAFDLRLEAMQCSYVATGVYPSYDEIAWIFELGAKCDKGTHIGYMQYELSEIYLDEDGAIPIDYDLGLYWARRAQENEYPLSGTDHIRYLEACEQNYRLAAKKSLGKDQLSLSQIRGWFDSGVIEAGRKKLFA